MPLALSAVLAFIIRYAIINAMIAVGLGFTTFIGLNELFGDIQANIQSYLGGVSSDIYQFLAIAGFFKGVAIILGAVNGRIAFSVTKKLGILF